MLQLLSQGQYALFAMLIFTIVFSLTCHEFGHAWMAKRLGDDTAERMGRLNLNPLSHIDPVGLLLVVMVGFGYAKPVPITPSKLRHNWGGAAVAFAGPFVNLLIAVVSINLLVWGLKNNIAFFSGDAQTVLFVILAKINLLLMLFNLIPLGPLDGHYILPWLLPRDLGSRYERLNARYGVSVFMLLIVLSVLGLPIFRWLMGLSEKILPLITFV